MMVLTEDERKEILSKYADDTSAELLNYLKRNLTTGEDKVSWGDPLKYIVINGKLRYLKGNKKSLINKIDSIVSAEWVNLDEKIRRRTIKKYIDGISM